MDAPEFSRPARRDEIGAVPLAFELAATADECAALAKRFDLIAIDALSGKGQVLVRDKAFQVLLELVMPHLVLML